MYTTLASDSSRCSFITEVGVTPGRIVGVHAVI